jgi:hypothetical protein
MSESILCNVKIIHSIYLIAFILFFATFQTTIAAPINSNGATEGGKCTVSSGSNKGKSGTYSKDNWGNMHCEGDWGSTECRPEKNGKAKCQDAKLDQPNTSNRFDQKIMPPNNSGMATDPINQPTASDKILENQPSPTNAGKLAPPSNTSTDHLAKQLTAVDKTRLKGITTGKIARKEVSKTVKALKKLKPVSADTNFKGCGFGICICTGDEDCNDLFTNECSEYSTGGVCTGSGDNTVCVCYP